MPWSLALLVLPVVLGDLWIFTVARARGGRTHGGGGSVLVWNACFVLLLLHAAWSVACGSLWLSGWVGFALLWAAALLRALAHRQLRHWYAARIVLRDGQQLVTSGPYRRLRHPLHLGLVGEMAGLVLLSPTWLAAGVLAVAILTLLARNLREDRALLLHFGARFAAYRQHSWDVVDWLPRGPMRRSS